MKEIFSYHPHLVRKFGSQRVSDKELLEKPPTESEINEARKNFMFNYTKIMVDKDAKKDLSTFYLINTSKSEANDNETWSSSLDRVDISRVRCIENLVTFNAN